jgi:PAS domain S-box-containing protein
MEATVYNYRLTFVVRATPQDRGDGDGDGEQGGLVVSELTSGRADLGAASGNTASDAATSEGIDPSLAQAIVRETGEAVVVADREGTILVWNGGAERVFGHSSAEAVGANLDLIIPTKLRQRHWEGFQRTLGTGITRYADTMLSVPATHRDGHRVSVEFSVALLHDAAGDISGILAIMRDVTERRNADQALHARLAALERRQALTPAD